jgi:predicted transposase/invertase (TIGR01784 family)
MNTEDTNENKQAVKRIHDKFFWDIYGRPSNAAGFLKDFLPSNILKKIDLDWLSVDKKSYLSEEYKEHFSDLVVKTRFKGKAKEDVFVYFLLEHKSSIPVRPAFQLLRYMVEQWHELEKQGALGSKLPPVFPILMYHGEKGWTQGVHFQDIVNIPHDDMKAYIPDFQYFLSDAAREDEDRYNTSAVIKCWFLVVKYIKDPAMREKLFELVKLLYEFLDQSTADEYVDIFYKYLANADSNITKTDAVEAIETIFPGRGADMAKGWAQEYVDEGMEKGMEKGMIYDAREMLLEALDAKFSSKVPADVHATIQALNNRILLKRLLRSAIQSKSINGFKKTIDELTKES